MEYYLITFSNTHTAIAAQKYLEGKLVFHVLPTLRELSASCGISLQIDASPYETIRDCMNQFATDQSMYKIYLITAVQIQEMKL